MLKKLTSIKKNIPEKSNTKYLGVIIDRAPNLERTYPLSKYQTN